MSGHAMAVMILPVLTIGKVLERVITDNHRSIGLDREIERLRDR